KVADFGLAKLGGEGVDTKLTMTNMAMGTPDYVAPESLEAGAEVDHRADLYAVGVMIYEMLTGKVPRGNFKPPSSALPGLDPRYDQLVAKAMEADREDRYQRASEISDTIYQIATTPPAPAAPAAPDPPKRTLLTGEPVVAPRDSTRPQTPPAAKKPLAPEERKSPAGLIAGVLILAVLIGGAGMWKLKSIQFPAPTPEPVVSVPPSAAPVEPKPTDPVSHPVPEPSQPPASAPKQVVVSPPKPEPVSPPAAPATPALPDTVDLAPWTDGIDLLPYIDLEQDTIEPGWTRDGTALITGNRDSAMVKLPVVAPEEYDLRLRITRTEPGQAITLVLTRKEHEFVWTGGAYGDGMFAFGGFQGNPLFAKSPGEAKKDSKPCFEEGRLYDVQLSVRNAGAVAYVEGKWVTRLPADLGEMRLPNISPMLGLGQLGLSTYQAAFRVDALQLREITGKAKLLRPVPAPATKPPTPAMTQTDTPAPTAPVTPPVPAP
ncbi:MAG: protein kinase, partial [Verrucomicrobiae bacterium]|nr:protein kinase [Verrucomicrobiae bacterium]